MLTPEQIKRRALNRYPDFLRSLCTSEQFFPLSVFGAGLVRPKDFVADREAIETLRKQSKEQIGFGYEISWEERNFRRLGIQKIPATVTFSTQEDYVRFLKKQTEVQQFLADHSLILMQCPELEAWMKAKPLKIVIHNGTWQGLLDVCVYLRNHPRPDCYLRELPIEVDTKFIENNKGILTELLPIAAPHTVGEDLSSFESRFGFRSKQPLVRMRFLDGQLAAQLAFSMDDFAVPLNQFCGLSFSKITVLIVENEMTFLTLPALPATIALFGAGDAAALLTGAPWLNSCRLFYWGDLDSHGFETLSHLRKAFPHVVSVLMDEKVFASHSDYAVTAAVKRSKEKLVLTSTEQALHDQLVKDGKLLEQERISNKYSKFQLWAAIVSTNELAS